MPDRRRSNCSFPRSHAVHPITDVFARHAGVLRLVRRRRRALNQLRRITGQPIAVDLDFAILAKKDPSHARTFILGHIQFQNRPTGVAHRDSTIRPRFLRPDFHRTRVIRAQGPLHLIEGVDPTGHEPPAVFPITRPSAKTRVVAVVFKKQRRFVRLFCIRVSPFRKVVLATAFDQCRLSIRSRSVSTSEDATCDPGEEDGSGS